jgi:hypothetical protein
MNVFEFTRRFRASQTALTISVLCLIAYAICQLQYGNVVSEMVIVALALYVISYGAYVLWFYRQRQKWLNNIRSELAELWDETKARHFRLYYFENLTTSIKGKSQLILIDAEGGPHSFTLLPIFDLDQLRNLLPGDRIRVYAQPIHLEKDLPRRYRDFFPASMAGTDLFTLLWHIQRENQPGRKLC